MKREEMIAAIQAAAEKQGMVDVSDENIFIQGVWEGAEYIAYKVFYVTPAGVASCPEEDFENIDCYDRDELTDMDDETIEKIYNTIK